MRIWTLHPRYLDTPGLTALWRETLGARAVLAGETTGYRHHPQLTRFRALPEPLAAVGSYLAAVHDESVRRGFRFDAAKVPGGRVAYVVDETDGQLLYEWRLLQCKLADRAPALYEAHCRIAVPDPHPLFRIVPGPVQAWERVRADVGGGPPPSEPR